MRDLVIHQPSGREIDLQAPTVEDEALLRSILNRPTKTKAKHGELLCRKHGGPLYLQRRNGGVFACHWPGTEGAGEPHRIALMSVEHRVQVEYIARAAEREGLPTATEVVLPHVRPDLVVNGKTAFEVQRSYLSVAQAKARTTKAVRGGMDISLWISDKGAAGAPKWLGQVPSVRVHAADWKRLPGLGAATVESGLSRFTPEHCYGGHGIRCITSAGRCTGWRFRREPLLGVTLDRLSVGLATGDFTAVRFVNDVHMIAADQAGGLEYWRPPEPPAAPPIQDTAGERVACRAEPSRALALVPPPRPEAPSRPAWGCQYWSDRQSRYCGTKDVVGYLNGSYCDNHSPAAIRASVATGYPLTIEETR